MAHQPFSPFKLSSSSSSSSSSSFPSYSPAHPLSFNHAHPTLPPVPALLHACLCASLPSLSRSRPALSASWGCLPRPLSRAPASAPSPTSRAASTSSVVAVSECCRFSVAFGIGEGQGVRKGTFALSPKRAEGGGGGGNLWPAGCLIGLGPTFFCF